METQAGGPGAFTRFDLARVPSPCFVVDEAAVRRNLATLKQVGEQGSAKVLLALKAFSMWALADMVGEYLDGVCASGLWEARLAREHYRGELTTYSPAYKAADLPEILRLSDTVIFNSPDQIARFAPEITKARAEGEVFEIGLRLNPEHSEAEVAKYDPCQTGSRLGFPVSQLRPEHLDGVDGLHIHALCEQGFEPLNRIWKSLEPRLEALLPRLKWLNLGGGHHITRADYDIQALTAFLRQVHERHGVEVYLEPGEAIALDTGILVGEILDTFDNGLPVAITDISATCHMPDVIEAPYRPAMLNEADTGVATRLGGPSCLAGDIIGDYMFATPPRPGDRIAFLDQAHYSMVKTNTFNGVPLPAIALWNSDTDALRLVREFDYADFRDRLS
ncbi:MAG: carboxynorspermidine decarboxylase [Phenylobacterium sp.]|uniref:carboxynorspermidine decarboxylase n=1 Tax=Phenylobacterium sp. TaxID=1871053 RepID=UPI001B7BBFCE|nr:carboxynorspermidine decarboxylase [Phenylobacterium sp.]MBP6546901.1 carboxynorspermidine decarboxylase [Phenylobacterium sp.]MBP7651084.1 carboxynorspermidine decarboxylase [Phenylobacterium sp.]MBP7815972.1 carboxynorspermidine decarboxylase [Phenylobacterium sp.]MBP9755627.1 carboxynorspermidine decarboxylase [Phenylobacterium sp.]